MGKLRPGRDADHSPPSSAAVMEEWSYTSTHPLGHTGPVKRSLYLYMYIAFAGLDNKLYKMHGTYINILYVLF